MLVFIIFICTLSLLTRLVIATDVGGVLLQNTVWTKANNPYHVIADVQVPRNVTLTIKPGVQIVYDNLGDFEMLVKGYLQVQGTAGQRVTFDGSMATNNTKWMLTFKAANLSQSSIINAQFIGPKNAAQLAEVPSSVPVNTGQVVFQFCIFTSTQINTDAGIFYPWNSYVIPTLVVQNSTIIDSIVSNGNNAPELIKLLGNHLQSVTINVLALYNGLAMVECRGSNVSIFWQGYVGAYFEMNDTTLTNVSTIKVGVYGLRTFFTIRRSTLLNATILLNGPGPGDGVQNLNIISSKLTVPRAVEIQTGSIQCSTITSIGDNSNTTGVIAGSISIVNSSIFDFNFGLRILSFRTPMGNITNSNFYKNSLYNIVNLGDSDVNAIGNWWGKKNNIGDTLFDYWKNINYGEIIYTNYAQNRIEQQC